MSKGKKWEIDYVKGQSQTTSGPSYCLFYSLVYVQIIMPGSLYQNCTSDPMLILQSWIHTKPKLKTHVWGKSHPILPGTLCRGAGLAMDKRRESTAKMILGLAMHKNKKKKLVHTKNYIRSCNGHNEIIHTKSYIRFCNGQKKMVHTKNYIRSCNEPVK